MLSPSSPSQKNLSEEDSSGSDAGSEVSLEPETDRFGFILTNGTTAGNLGPPPELVRQRETKWINIIQQWDRILLRKTSKVKVQCQKGIPASLRAKCWPLLCGATDKMKENENLYQSLDSKPALQSWVDVIERDLDRQFPFHEMFLSKDGHGQRGLFRVLKAYTQYQPDEGYCQAQGPVAAVLLMNMPAEEAFWCLVQISEQFLPGYYSPLLEGVLFDAAMLSWVLKRTCPAVHKHLQHHGVEPLMFATDWLMCLFTRHLPFNTLLRVWDLFFCYGVRVLLQVAVVLVRRVLGRAEQRKQCQGQMETLEKLRGVREQIQEEDDTFIAEVCSVPLSTRDLEKHTVKELEKWRKDKPSSTFDPRGRCHGFQMAWARARKKKEEREKKERQTGNLSVPLARSASTLSLSPSLLHKRWRKGGKPNAGDWEGGSKVVRHLSMGAKEDLTSWTELNFKKVQDVEEEEDIVSDELKQETEPNLTEQTEVKEVFEEPIKTDTIQSIPEVHIEEAVTVDEPTENVKETGILEKEGGQLLSEHTEETNVEAEVNQGHSNNQSVENIHPQPSENAPQHQQGEELGSLSQTHSHLEKDEGTEVKDINEETEKQVSDTNEQSEKQYHEIEDETEKQCNDMNEETEKQFNDMTEETEQQFHDMTEETEQQFDDMTEETEQQFDDIKDGTEKEFNDIKYEREKQCNDIKEETEKQFDDMNEEIEKEFDDMNEEITKQFDDMNEGIEKQFDDQKDETEKQVVEVAEQTAALQDNQSEIQKEADADINQVIPNSNIHAPEDSIEEQIIQAEIVPHEGLETNIIKHDVQQTQVDTEPSETRTDTSPGTEKESNCNEMPTEDPDLAPDTQKQHEDVIIETDMTSSGDVFEARHCSPESLEEIKIEEAHTQTETEMELAQDNVIAHQDLEIEVIKTDLECEGITEAETLILPSPECIQQEECTEMETEAVTDCVESSEASAHFVEKECDTVLTQEEENIIYTVHVEKVDGDHTEAEETPSETQIKVVDADSVALLQKEQAGNVATKSELRTSSVEISSKETAQEQAESQIPVENSELIEENTVEEDRVFISTPSKTDSPHGDNIPEVEQKDSSQAETSNPTQTSGRRSSRSSGDFCVRRSSNSNGSRLARRLSEDLFTSPQKSSQSQSSPSQELQHAESQPNPGAVSKTLPEDTQPLEVKPPSSTMSVTEKTAIQQEPQVPAKRFGLFRRLREQPKKAKEKQGQKMQVPKILIQDFSDGTGKPAEEVEEEKLSSRERRRRRREQERKEKEEERLRKKKEKESEKERERERRKPQTRGKTFHVQKESRGNDDVSHVGKSGSKTIRHSTSYAESYF